MKNTHAGLGLRLYHYSALKQLNEPTAPLVEQLGNVFFFFFSEQKSLNCVSVKQSIASGEVGPSANSPRVNTGITDAD